ncbi:50S ribosomal protein L33 2 [Candidatus Malacoplasma girerdii]|uniref:Large ribosomal subunit protein bL33 n=1 Tax=Candidatus Malacoplasma girerdii TaxID=1318617 RepID=A0A097SSF3_9BACT|nr:50S ribosomal protein L33 2 [Candidatus Malacoplasma girerdii]ASJ89122.1 MAG: 50S ribosomal protein L33 [Candidatus Malacoplasma girerdii]
MKINVPMVCSVCNSINYRVKKEKANPKRLELRKYCPKCQKVTLHKESR